jgi:hypothetical protein
MVADGGRCVTFWKICKSRRLWHDRNVEAISSFGVREALPSGCNQWDYRPSFATNRAPTLPGNGPAERRFFSGAVRVLPCAAQRPVSLLFLVALTGIEPAT